MATISHGGFPGPSSFSNCTRTIFSNVEIPWRSRSLGGVCTNRSRGHGDDRDYLRRYLDPMNVKCALNCNSCLSASRGFTPRNMAARQTRVFSETPGRPGPGGIQKNFSLLLPFSDRLRAGGSRMGRGYPKPSGLSLAKVSTASALFGADESQAPPRASDSGASEGSSGFDEPSVSSGEWNRSEDGESEIFTTMLSNWGTRKAQKDSEARLGGFHALRAQRRFKTSVPERYRFSVKQACDLAERKNAEQPR